MFADHSTLKVFEITDRNKFPQSNSSTNSSKLEIKMAHSSNFWTTVQLMAAVRLLFWVLGKLHVMAALRALVQQHCSGPTERKTHTGRCRQVICLTRWWPAFWPWLELRSLREPSKSCWPTKRTIPSADVRLPCGQIEEKKMEKPVGGRKTHENHWTSTRSNKEVFPFAQIVTLDLSWSFRADPHSISHEMRCKTNELSIAHQILVWPMFFFFLRYGSQSQANSGACQSVSISEKQVRGGLYFGVLCGLRLGLETQGHPHVVVCTHLDPVEPWLSVELGLRVW